MFRKLSTSVLFLLLGTPLMASAQGTGTLAGRVIDAELGEGLPGANVIVVGTQLGAATDLDGNYRIIGIPVGQYDVTARFVGYEDETVTNVQISSGYTTQQDFGLRSGIELEEVVVEYERPIIQRDAVGVPRVVTGEEIQNLPVRGVASVAAIQAGVVSNEGSDNLFVRGGREQEVAYYVDGVKVSGGAAVAVNQQAIQEQEMLIGTIPARYGDVQSGVISITTKSGGRDFFGAAEVITSELLDSYGYNLGALSFGGPLVPGRASFFASISGELRADNSPYGVSTLQLSDDALAAIEANPQVLRAVCATAGGCGGEEFQFVNFPTDLPAGTTAAQLVANPSAFGINVPDGYEIRSGQPLFAAETYTADRFESVNAKSNPYSELTFNGNVTMDPLQSVTLRLGGAYQTSQLETFAYGASLYNRNNFNINDSQTYRLYGTLRQRLSNIAFYQLQGEFQNYYNEVYPQRFSDNPTDFLRYGDAEDPANQLATRYVQVNPGTGVYEQRAADGAFGVGSAYGTFQLPGVLGANYQRRDFSTLRFSGSATTQLGVNQIEFGAEFEQQTRRFYNLNPANFARYVADGSVEGSFPGMPAGGINTYDELPYSLFEPRSTYYGYSFNGLNEVNDEDVRAFGEGTNFNVAPYKPIYYAGYIQDKIEYRDLVINLGLRVDVFDNNTLVLRDIFAPLPITRAGDLTPQQLQSAGLDGLPSTIGSDYAVYFGNTNDLGTAVGFRDLDGRFYDLSGNRTTQQLIDAAGRVNVTSQRVAPEMFEDYEAKVTFMPRIGVSFPVTDQALFFASYNVTSQRPTEFAFTPFSTYNNISIGTTYANSNLEPEKTTQYELGFRQRVAERAAVTLSGFYRTQENKIALRNMNQIGAPEQFAYNTFLNVDFTTARGVELGFELRRTNNVAVNANYTLSFSEGTGSDATTAGNVAWLSGTYPNILSPTDFDRRHSANLSIDYRLGEGEGPEIGGVRPLAGFGFNVLGTFKSGLPYSPVANVGDLRTSAALPLQSGINDTQLPATTQIDLKVDRNFNLGFGDFRAYVWVQNLLDNENVISVYRYTGTASTSGFLESPLGTSFLNSATVRESALFNYQQFERGPVYIGSLDATSSGGGNVFYAPPRRIRLGLLFDF